MERYYEKEVLDIVKKTFNRFKVEMKFGDILLTFKKIYIDRRPFPFTVQARFVCPNSAWNPKKLLIRLDDIYNHGETEFCYVEIISHYDTLKDFEAGCLWVKEWRKKHQTPTPEWVRRFSPPPSHGEGREG